MTDHRQTQGSNNPSWPSDVTKHLAYAEAAIMLLECVMIKLVEKKVLTPTEIASALEDAIDTKRQMVKEGEHPEISAVASGLLLSLANSLAAIGRPE